MQFECSTLNTSITIPECIFIPDLPYRSGSHKHKRHASKSRLTPECDTVSEDADGDSGIPPQKSPRFQTGLASGSDLDSEVPQSRHKRFSSGFDSGDDMDLDQDSLNGSSSTQLITSFQDSGIPHSDSSQNNSPWLTGGQRVTSDNTSHPLNQSNVGSNELFLSLDTHLSSNSDTFGMEENSQVPSERVGKGRFTRYFSAPKKRSNRAERRRLARERNMLAQNLNLTSPHVNFMKAGPSSEDAVEKENSPLNVIVNDSLSSTNNEETSLASHRTESKLSNQPIVPEHSQTNHVNDRRVVIPESNKGHKLLKALGWQGGGLGKNESGRFEPVSVSNRHPRNRKGLGTESVVKTVTPRPRKFVPIPITAPANSEMPIPTLTNSQMPIPTLTNAPRPTAQNKNKFDVHTQILQDGLNKMKTIFPDALQEYRKKNVKRFGLAFNYCAQRLELKVKVERETPKIKTNKTFTISVDKKGEGRSIDTTANYQTYTISVGKGTCNYIINFEKIFTFCAILYF